MSAEAKTVTAPGTISPKVFWPLVVAVVLTFIGSFLAAVTPEMLSALGPFAVPAAISLTAVANVVAGYLKSDELRDLGVQATAAVLAVEPTSQVVPADEPPLSFTEPVVEEPVPAPSTREQSITEELVARQRSGSTAGGAE